LLTQQNLHPLAFYTHKLTSRTNNPATLTDPLGLRPCFIDGSCGFAPSWGPPGGWGGFGGYTLEGIPVWNATGQGVLAGGAGAQCPNNFCSGFAPVGNGQIAFVQFVAHAGLGGSGYDMLTQPISDPTLSGKGTYALFSTYAATQGLNPSTAYTVRGWNQGATFNIEVLRTQVEVVPPGYVRDPFAFTHHGATSYLDPWSLFGAGHYVLGDTAGGYHEDAFGVLNPLHYADYLAGRIFGRGPTMTFTCQANVGCY
jgi:hypothetical protein